MGNEETIRKRAIEFVKKNKVRLAKSLTNVNSFPPDTKPISVFMAGSPGAGKTEFSKNLIKILEGDKEHRVVRIDGDEVRPFIPGYSGTNSNLFQGVAPLVVEKMHDLVLHQNQSFILDGTFSKYTKAVDNIDRSLNKNRPVFIFYLYQEPNIAWKFTQARERVEKRNIPKSAFIDQFLGAKDVVEHISQNYKNKVVIFIVKKDYEKNTVGRIVKLEHNKNIIDDYVERRYTKLELEKLL